MDTEHIFQFVLYLSFYMAGFLSYGETARFVMCTT